MALIGCFSKQSGSRDSANGSRAAQDLNSNCPLLARILCIPPCPLILFASTLSAWRVTGMQRSI